MDHTTDRRRCPPAPPLHVPSSRHDSGQRVRELRMMKLSRNHHLVLFSYAPKSKSSDVRKSEGTGKLRRLRSSAHLITVRIGTATLSFLYARPTRRIVGGIVFIETLVRRLHAVGATRR